MVVHISIVKEDHQQVTGYPRRCWKGKEREASMSGRPLGRNCRWTLLTAETRTRSVLGWFPRTSSYQTGQTWGGHHMSCLGLSIMQDSWVADEPAKREESKNAISRFIVRVSSTLDSPLVSNLVRAVNRNSIKAQPIIQRKSSVGLGC